MLEAQGGETYPEMIFAEVVEKLGGAAVMQGVLEVTLHEQEQNREGVTLHNADHTVVVSTSRKGLSFSYHKWGTYLLESERVAEILQAQALAQDEGQATESGTSM